MPLNINSGYGQELFYRLGIAKEPGKIIFVSATGTAYYDDYQQMLRSSAPDSKVHFANTIDGAVNQATANAGDIILVAPGHTETLATATAMNLDVAGIRIIGLGEGTKRPKITLGTATTTTIPVSAADITVQNIVFSAAFADIVSVFTLTGAANFKIKNCEFVAAATNQNVLSIVDTSAVANAADGLTIEGCTWIEPDAATLYMVKGDEDIDRLTIKDCYVNLGVNTSDLPALVNMASGKDVTNLQIVGNKVIRLNDANPLLVVADTTTANTGIIADNYVRHADTVGELLVTAATNIGFFNNYATAVADGSGFLLPAADS